MRPLLSPLAARGLRGPAATGLLAAFLLCSCNQGSSRDGNSIARLRTFATTYGTAGDDCILDVQPTFDFGRIVAGVTDPMRDGRGDGWLMKQDIDGNVEWSRCYGDRTMDLSGNSGLNWSANEAFDSNQIDVAADDLGGCVVVGGRFVERVTDDGVSGPVFHPVAIRLDRDGRVVWRLELPGGERGGRFLDVEKEEWSDSYFAVGYSEERGLNLDGRNRDALVVSISGDGEVRWQLAFGNEAHEVVTGIDFVSGGRGAPPYALTLVGNRTRGGGPDGNVGVFMQIENDPNGVVLVNEILDQGEGVNLLDVQREMFTQDFHVVGVVKGNKNHYYTSNDNSFNLLLAEYDSTNGSLHWDETFEVSVGFNSGDHGFAVTPAVDRGLYVAGYGGLSHDAVLAYSDENGNFDRNLSVSYGALDLAEEFHAIQRTATGSFLVAGKKDGRAWAGVIGVNHSFEWENTYTLPGGDGHAQAAVESFRNGNATGYHVAGTGPAGGWVMHLDRQGNVRWIRSVHDDTRDAIHAVRQIDDDGDGLRDDGYLCLGTTGSSRWREKDAWVMKVDRMGAVQWQKRLGRHDLDDGGFALELLPADGFLVAGTAMLQGDLGSMYFEAFTFAGDLAWRRVLSHGDGHRVVDLVVDGANSVYYAGATEIGSGVLGKLNADGTDASGWTDVKLDFAPRAIVVDDRGRIVAAGAAITGPTLSDREVALVRVDASGSILAQRRLRAPTPGPDDGAFALLALDDGLYLAADTRSQAVTGETRQDEHGQEVPCANVHLLRLRSDLEIDWERTYSNVYEDNARVLSLAEDGTLMVAGCTDTAFLVTGEDARADDGWLLKMELDGRVAPDCPSYGEVSSSRIRTAGDARTTNVGPGTGLGIVVEDTDLRTFDLENELTVDTLCRTDAREYPVTFRVQGNGRVVDPRHGVDCRTVCERSIREGLPVALVAIPAEGETFLGWDQNCPDGQFVVDGPVTCTARFSGTGAGDNDGGEPGELEGYWEFPVVCQEDCSPQATEEIRQFRIEPRGGSNFTIESFANSQTYQATRNGNRITWNASYQFLGEQWQETGSFTINGDGTLTLNISYTRSTELETCSGTCTGTGFHL